MHALAHRPPRTRRVFVLAAAITVGGVACGGDDDGSGDATTALAPATTTVVAASTRLSGDPASGDLAAYCADEVRLDRIFAMSDFEDPTAREAAFESMAPIVARLLETGPPEVAEHLRVLNAAYEQVRASGAPDAFFTDDVAAADAAVHAYDLANCGWATVSVVAGDYHFTADFPKTAGTVSLEVTNTGAEPHALILARKHDDVTASALDAFNALASEEDFPDSFDETTRVFAEPGGSDFALADLEPGQYVAFCPIPVGPGADGEGDGPPHFTVGMVTAFDVV